VTDEADRKRGLAEVYRDPRQFLSLMVVFIALFSRFLSDRGYYIRGIDPDRIRPIP
jgi:hypothetical protein